MSRSDISNALAECLIKMKAGATIDEAVLEYPHLADQLRSLLGVAQSIQLPEKAARVPSSAQIDSRRRMLAQTREIKKKKGSAWFWTILYFFRRNAGSFAFGVVAVVLLFIALGSAQALPGDSLYGVKIAAEKAGTSININPGSSVSRQANYDTRRLSEVNQMILEKRTGDVQLAGYLELQNPQGWKVDGIALKISSQLEQQANGQSGIYVDVSGFLNNLGQVEVKQIKPRLINLSGTLQSIGNNLWKVNNQEVRIDQNTHIQGKPQTGKVVFIEAAMIRDTKQLLAFTASFGNGMEPETTDPVMTASEVTPSAEPEFTPTVQTTPVINRQELPTPAPQEDNNPPEKKKTDDHSGSSGGGDDSTHNGGDKTVPIPNGDH
jgi:hypothetical protein